MPYAEDVNELPPDPAVKIFLQGQLILLPQNDKTCEIGVNRCATNHQLSFELRQRMVDPATPDVVIMRILEKIESPDVQIGLNPPDDDDDVAVIGAGAKRFIPTDVFGRTETDDPQDFRWLVDLSSKEFHNKEVAFNGNDTQPNIKIKDGIFYTAQRTDPAVVTVNSIETTEDRNGHVEAQEPVRLNRIASIMGVNIYLPDDGSAQFKLTWKQNGDDKEIVLEKPTAGSGVKHYEIRIINDPPFIASDELPAHQELREYYKAVDGVFDGNDQIAFHPFELEFLPGVIPPLGSPAVPCMPIGGGK